MKSGVIVIGAMYSPNLGDGVICQTVSEIITKECKKDAVILGISGASAFSKTNEPRGIKRNIKSYLGKTPGIAELKRFWKRKKIYKKLDEIGKNSDTLVFAGGQLFLDCFADFLINITRWARKNHVSVIFNGCGVGPISDRGKEKISEVLHMDCVKTITVREPVERFYDIYSSDLKVTQVYDPAIEVANYFPMKFDAKIPLGIGIIHPVNFRKNCVSVSEEDYKEIIKQIIDFCEKEHVLYELFTNGDPLDDMYCKLLMRELKIANSAERPMEPQELLQIVTRYNRIISFRLHSHIIASSYHIPTAAIVWDNKVREFMKMIGREEYCISLETVPEAETIRGILRKLLQNENYRYQENIDYSSCVLKQLLAE